MKNKCTDCPYEVGDLTERDCAFPDCVGGWETVCTEQAKEIIKLSEELAEAHRMLTTAVQLMPEYWDPAIQEGAHKVMWYWDKIQKW